MLKYEKLLEELDKTDWKIVTLTEFCQLPLDTKALAIKHVIQDVNRAKAMALLGFNRKIYSTFFLSDSQPYFQDWKVHSNYIYQLGHELGIQPNFMVAAGNMGLNIHQYIMQLQMKFGQFGIVINGYASLESDITKKIGFKDYEYFYDYAYEEKLIEIKKPMSDSNFIAMGIHPLIEYGILYFVEKLERRNFINIHKTINFDFLHKLTGKTIVEV